MLGGSQGCYWRTGVSFNSAKGKLGVFRGVYKGVRSFMEVSGGIFPLNILQFSQVTREGVKKPIFNGQADRKG